MMHPVAEIGGKPPPAPFRVWLLPEGHRNEDPRQLSAALGRINPERQAVRVPSVFDELLGVVQGLPGRGYRDDHDRLSLPGELLAPARRSAA
jgi:hypothetical protein